MDLWNINRKEFNTLNKNRNFDILIVGGGITGISLCYYLKDFDYKICLIEQNELLSSVTYNTTAKLTYLQKDILSKIRKSYNDDITKQYLNSQIEAINNIKNIINKENIECDLEKNDSYLFTTDKNNIPKIIKEYNLYKKYNINAKLINELPINLKIETGFMVPDTYVFHPIKYCYGLINSFINNKNIEIYENTRMINHKKKNNYYEVYLNNNIKIDCKYLIIASHYPPFLLPYFFPLRTHIKKEFITYKKSEPLKFNAINIDKDIISIRFYKNYMIEVSKEKNLSKKAINNETNYNSINYDIITEDYLPIIGKIDNNMFLATGYNAWGMTNSNIAAKTIQELITYKKSKYTNIFNPKRKLTLYKTYNFIINNINMVYNFINSKISLQDKAYIKYINGKKYGIYIDKENNEHIVKLNCPHMKCGLFFNKKEKTWDCPCHGSRFTIDGDIIKGPSSKCIKK